MTSLENLLIGKSIKDELTTIILNFNFEKYLSPINDIRGTNLYRLQVSKVLVKDTIINTINKFNFKG
jgi:CO/xanthine dehydrogenase FAD-binding subunit